MGGESRSKSRARAYATLAEASAGALGQLCSTLLLYPLDTSKTRVQADLGTHACASGSDEDRGDDHRLDEEGSSSDDLAMSAVSFKTWADVVSGEGEDGRRGDAPATPPPAVGGGGSATTMAWFLDLYTGIETKAVQTLVSQFLFFYTYEYIKKAWRRKLGGRPISPFHNVAIGMVAGCVNVLVTQPLDTFVTMKQSRSALAGARDPPRSKPASGVAGYYAALGPSLFLSINPGLQYAIFDQVKSYVLARRQRRWKLLGAGKPSFPKALGAFEAFILGALSKSIATVVTYPAIRGKVVCQSNASANGDGAATKFKGLGDAIGTIVRAQGMGGLYKGLPQQLTKTVLSAAIGLMLKEKISQAERTFAAMLLKGGKSG